MDDLNYYKTLIAVADDCPAAKSEVPTSRGNQPTVAVVQYGLLVDRPHAYTQEDVLFETWLARQDLPDKPSKVEAARLRERFFSKDQPCLRSSPLPKRHGWGLLFDAQGRVALCPMESAEYRRIVAGQVPGVKVLKALRSSRA